MNKKIIKSISFNDIETLYKWYCPYVKCEWENLDYYIREGDVLRCRGCGRDILLK